MVDYSINLYRDGRQLFEWLAKNHNVSIEYQIKLPLKLELIDTNL